MNEDIYRERAIEAQNIIIDMRDAMLSVLVKHHICPMHWLVDRCNIDLYGKNTPLGTDYEKRFKCKQKSCERSED